jgi:hypothetical protein
VFIHQNLSPPGITITYKISAVNDVGESPMSVDVSVLLGTIPEVPGVPTRVSATQTEIEIEWQAQDDGGTPITQYNVQIDSGAGGSFEDAGSVSSGT